MTFPAFWDTGKWDDSSWNTLLVEGAITNANDVALGGIATIDNVGGLITENPDIVAGEIGVTNFVSMAATNGNDVAAGEVSVFLNTLEGAITENHDVVSSVISQIFYVTGAITENPDDVYGTISMYYALSGDITEGEDIVNNDCLITIGVSGAILEHADIARGNIKGPKGQPKPGGGWAPQFYYRRDWEPEPDVPVDKLEIDVELEPEFIPQPLPIDPTVARMIEIMMRGPQVVSTDEDDLESILMNL